MKKIIALLMAFLLAGCAAGEHTRVITKMLGGTEEAPEAMRNVHLVGWVNYDEQSPVKFSGPPGISLYATGIRKGTSMVQYRSIPVSTPRIEKAILWKEDGWMVDTLAALVPDHIGVLKKGDIIEWRSISYWDSLVNFERDGEGQVVTRVLCRKSDPDFESCRQSLPRFGKQAAAGPTGTEFPVSVKDYGFTFSKFYDLQGAPIRALPEVDVSLKSKVER